jgi:cytoskeletal protein CcmA (bactofilin family)
MQRQREARDASGELDALLGRGSEFNGKLRFEGKVRIDGTFSGEISTNDSLHIGEGAKVSAEIRCGTVVVEGQVYGNITAMVAVELRLPAKMQGDITTPSLMIEKGVTFDGHSKMEHIEALDGASDGVSPRAASEANRSEH